MDLTIAQISDIHVGQINFLPEKLDAAIEEINSLDPDLVILSGDVTMMGFRDEYIEAKKYVDKIDSKVLAIPGNHDVRYMGHIYFQEFFGRREWVDKFSDELYIIGLDTSLPDLDEGSLGRGKQKWLRRKLDEISNSCCKIVVMHHHLVPVPMTGRERAVLSDAGDVLDILTRGGVDLCLSGHRHTPYAWIVNNTAVVTAGSPSTRKVRATINQSYNIIRLTDEHIRVEKKDISGNKKLMAEYNKIKGKNYVITKS
ncbi:MAG: metallophosphoesterase [Candidatus Altiarchaeota archaeon]|nr:metallophosphoesterase [Candidatus Altiarchaeota archaeon]